jgi:hypothetical protein
MPLQNRITPMGDVIADAARGTLMGNRGILHDASKRLGTARWRHRAWICCRLSFKDRRREVMAPGRYTELLFLDEAIALAAGHRPCCECRRDDFRIFQEAWRRAVETSAASAGAIDRVLHDARIDPRTRRQVRFEAPLEDLPDGAFVLLPGDPSSPFLVLGDALLPWRPAGYGSQRIRQPGTKCVVLTPQPTLAVLRAGYAPSLHPTAIRR